MLKVMTSTETSRKRGHENRPVGSGLCSHQVDVVVTDVIFPRTEGKIFFRDDVVKVLKHQQRVGCRVGYGG